MAALRAELSSIERTYGFLPAAKEPSLDEPESAEEATDAIDEAEQTFGALSRQRGRDRVQAAHKGQEFPAAELRIQVRRLGEKADSAFDLLRFVRYVVADNQCRTAGRPHPLRLHSQPEGGRP